MFALTCLILLWRFHLRPMSIPRTPFVLVLSVAACYSCRAQVCAHDHAVLAKVSLSICAARDNFSFFLFLMNFLCSIIDHRLIEGGGREVLELVSPSQVIWPITLLYIAYSTSN